MSTSERISFPPKQLDYDMEMEVESSDSEDYQDIASRNGSSDMRNVSDCFMREDEGFNWQKFAKEDILLQWDRNRGYSVKIYQLVQQSELTESDLTAFQAKQLITEYLQVRKALEEKIDLKSIHFKVKAAFLIPAGESSATIDADTQIWDEDDELDEEVEDLDYYMEHRENPQLKKHNSMKCQARVEKKRKLNNNNNNLGKEELEVGESKYIRFNEEKKLQEQEGESTQFTIENIVKFDRVIKQIQKLKDAIIRTSCDVELSSFSVRLTSLVSIRRLLAEPVEVKANMIRFNETIERRGSNEFNTPLFESISAKLAKLNLKLIGQCLSFNLKVRYFSSMMNDYEGYNSQRLPLELDLKWISTAQILEVYCDQSVLNDYETRPIEVQVKLWNHVKTVIANNPVVSFLTGGAESNSCIKEFLVSKMYISANVYLGDFVKFGLDRNVIYIHTRTVVDKKMSEFQPASLDFDFENFIEIIAQKKKDIKIFDMYRMVLDTMFSRTYVFTAINVTSYNLDKFVPKRKSLNEGEESGGLAEEIIHAKTSLVYFMLAYEKQIKEVLFYAPKHSLWDLYID